MDKFIEKIYLDEILDECQFALMAIESMNSSLNMKEPTASLFFRASQDFLQHCGAISRIIWPPWIRDRAKNLRAQSRGTHLSSILGLEDSHALKDRSLRNLLEHYDESIDDWADTSPNKNIVDKMIIPRRSMIGGSAIREGDLFRVFETETLTFFFRGSTFNIQLLCEGVQDARQKVIARSAELDAN